MGKDNTIIKTKRQHYGQNEKNKILVKAKRQHYSQSEKTTI
jgi:hypothetical protein